MLHLIYAGCFAPFSISLFLKGPPIISDLSAVVVSQKCLRLKVNFHHHHAINHLILCLYAPEKILYFSCKW